MGIVRNIINKAVAKTANAISNAADLSQNQIEDIEKKKQDYLAEKPDMNNEESQQLIKRMLGTLGVEVYHAYLPKLNSIYTPVTSVSSNYAARDRIAYFDITKWVLDTEEDSLDKLVNVYHVLSQEECTIALIFHRTMLNCQVTMAVVNNNEDSDPPIVESYIKRLQDAIKGNFPGVVYAHEDGRDIPKCFGNMNKSKNIATVTNIATEKSDKFISQSIEKLLDGIVPEKTEQEYTFVLLATPSMETLIDKTRLSELYTTLAPFSEWQTNYTYISSDNMNSSFSAGIYLGASAGASMGASTGNTNGVNSSTTDNISRCIVPYLARTIIGGKIGGSETQGTFNQETISQNMGANASANFGVNFNRASNISVNIGKNEGITQNFTNHQIKHTLDILDKQMKRLDQCAALGMWKFASYVVSEDYNTANNVAHMYLALTQGEESFISQSAINLWDCDKFQEETKILFNEISHFQHPAFCLRNDLSDEWLMYPTIVDATTDLSGRELAYAFNLPRRSVAGFPVIECAEFGRNIVTYDEEKQVNGIRLGSVFHMHHEENTTVELDLNSLASHTFITGSTGSGKSNTVYQILNEASRKEVGFLVIEPAKGEYKHIYGNREDVKVYGTNSSVSDLLRINPFSFEKEIHILEHLDGLIEIFNVCWPMYAAMPAVLKSAIEKSYEDCGWNLRESYNPYGDDLYPTFADVTRNIKTIIDSSEYDNENKGAYKGSLITRLQSLTNGINGMIFTSDEISAEELFDKNVICDLSRVRSNETKSLMMGILVLKLQEYRMISGRMNADLKHITVLEEAHNLLKKTSTEQPVEGGNLLGKSVEMISNAIAEMRTYGEGFIIADQSPGLLDMSAIRNTNTKIIMRLPDENDRILVGKSACLNDNQITELARLPRGVAAVYQNEWIQPVLCKVDAVSHDNKLYSYIVDIKKGKSDNTSDRVEIAEMLCNSVKLEPERVMSDIRVKLDNIDIPASVQVLICKLLTKPSPQPNMEQIGEISKYLFPKAYEVTKEVCNDTSDKREWTRRIEEELKQNIGREIDDKTRIYLVHGLILAYVYIQCNDIKALQDWTERGWIK